jgi:hypothetical protein
VVAGDCVGIALPGCREWRSSIGAAELHQQSREVRGYGRFDLDRAVVARMLEPQPVGMERLAGKGNWPQGFRAEDIALLADERVATKASLQADLVSLPGP